MFSIVLLVSRLANKTPLKKLNEMIKQDYKQTFGGRIIEYQAQMKKDLIFWIKSGSEDVTHKDNCL